MTTSIRILTTSTLDSSPSVLLISPNGSKTLINCGEGCQRSFLERSNAGTAGGLRVRSVTRVCLTHIGHSAVGGLPGMILTTSDVAEAALTNVVMESTKKSEKNINNNSASDTNKNPRNKRKQMSPQQMPPSAEDQNMPGLDIVGPEGTQQFLHSLRHFMRRDRFQLRVHEGDYKQSPRDARSSKQKGKSGKRARKNADDIDGFCVQTIPLRHNLDPAVVTDGSCATEGSNDDGNPTHEQKRLRTDHLPGPPSNNTTVDVISFVFTTPPISGKFLPDKAKELGIPPGPLYAQLKSGKSVAFVDPSTGEERTVESQEVVTKGSPGVAVAVIYCPSIQVLEQLMQSAVLKRIRERGKGEPVLDVMIHMAPHSILKTMEYRTWMQTFGKTVEHISLETSEYLADCGDHIFKDEDGSPFHSAALGAMTRSLLHKELFPSPVPLTNNENGHVSRDQEDNIEIIELEAVSSSAPVIIRGTPMMEYVLIPRSKKGLTPSPLRSDVLHGISAEEREEIHQSAQASGAIDKAKQILREKQSLDQNPSDADNSLGELIFTGTGSAIPCKHRNVTGKYLRMRNGKAMLLDAGEGTTGQLLRVKQRHETDTDFTELLRDIKAVWISHPHADHHLGLLRFLTERNAICGQGNDPVVLMAPSNMFRFLSEYSNVDRRVVGSYIPLDCRDMVREKRNPLGDKLHRDLGITYCVSVPVAHCPNSFAVVIDGTAFGRVAYSGDCRPSFRFAEAGVNANLLIHEATFEDGMEAEAAVKRHCTVGEALEVGQRMLAKAMVLTHFSQRYPRIPPISGKINADETAVGTSKNENGISGSVVDSTNTGDVPVVFAFDFMTLTPRNVVTASKLTPALRLLYPGDDKEEEATEGSPHTQPSAGEVLSVPGMFAQKGIL